MSPGGYQMQGEHTPVPVIRIEGGDSPIDDNRTGTQRLDELAAVVLVLSSEALTISEQFKELLDAVLFLTQKVNTLERRLESMQGD